MDSPKAPSLSNLLRGFRRYQPFIAAFVGIALIAVVLPGTRQADEVTGVATGPGIGSRTGGSATAMGASPSDTAGVEAGGVPSAGGGPVSGGGAGAALSTGGTAPGGAVAAPTSPAAAVSSSTGVDPLSAPDCDRATGRIRVPSKFAPPCVAPFSGSNGGATYQGVTAKEIIVAIRYNPNPNPAVAATLTAAGAEDTREDVWATRQGWNDLFEAHYETYGRKVKIVYVEESGDDDEADRADAIKVATEIKPFAVWGGSGAFRDELVARGVLCLCGGRDAQFFLDRAPLLWGTQPSYEQWLGPAAEYIGKRLWNREAKWAGDASYKVLKRKIGLLYADDAESPVTVAGVKYMEREMANYGAQLADKISYVGDIETAQEQASVIIARLKDRGITTVAFWGDPLAPIFFTQEATNQNYRPEWLIVGGNLVDTTFFGRTYDQTQWAQAYGVSQLWARGPQAENEVFHAYQWHHGRPPDAKATYEIIYQTNWLFYTGIHLAGPNLNPETFRAGMFSFPVSGGGPTLITRSFGRHGLWPFDDYTAFDDVTEVWWDPAAVGENEIGQNGKGMWRYVQGGKRYRFGTWPTTEPKVFVVDGSVTKYDHVPPEDQFPPYEHRHYRGS